MTYNETVEKLIKLWTQIWLRDSTLQLNSWGCVQTLSFDILPVNNRKTPWHVRNLKNKTIRAAALSCYRCLLTGCSRIWCVRRSWIAVGLLLYAFFSLESCATPFRPGLTVYKHAHPTSLQTKRQTARQCSNTVVLLREEKDIMETNPSFSSIVQSLCKTEKSFNPTCVCKCL